MADTTGGFIIRTTTGDRGPYSVEQIQDLLNKGKLKQTTQIYDVAAKKVVAVVEALNRSADVPQISDDAEIAEEIRVPRASLPRSSGSKTNAGRAAESVAAPEDDPFAMPKPRGRPLRPPAPGMPNWAKYTMAVVASIGIAIGMYTWNQMRTQGAAKDQSASFKEGFTSALEVKDDPAYIRFLIDEFHEASFKAAKIESKDDKPPVYDQTKYTDEMLARIKKQRASPDPVLMKKWESRKKK
jgi:hypothetical protein